MAIFEPSKAWTAEERIKVAQEIASNAIRTIRRGAKREKTIPREMAIEYLQRVNHTLLMTAAYLNDHRMEILFGEQNKPSRGLPLRRPS